MGDALRACRALWSGERISFRSATVSFDDLICRPRPIQPGGPPLWFGVAATEANAARIAELGAGWLPMASEPEAIAPGTMATSRMLSTRESMQAELVRNVIFPHRMGKPEEFALLVEAIARNPYLNGENIRLDGAIRFPAK